MKSVLVCHSGGLDSSVLLAMCHARYERVEAFAVSYGQRHATELEHGYNVCKHYGITRHLVMVPDVFAGSALTGASEVPHCPYDDESTRETVVPNRNMVLLALAGAKAISLGIEAVAYAAHAGDHAIYPDCRPLFVEDMRRAFGRCHAPPIQLLTPFVDVDKRGIVIQGHVLEVPFGMTWTCYEGGDVHCGRCGSCVERREAFTLAGVDDPTEYHDASDKAD